MANEIDARGLRPHVQEIAYRMFFATADGNYLGARHAFFSRRIWDFWWQTLHAVEKYLKTTLLVNGRPAKEGAHDVIDLFGQVAMIDTRLVPPAFIAPPGVGDAWWDYPDDVFLRRLNEFGSASNRYGTSGYTIHTHDLWRADQLIYWARRYARPVTQLVDGAPLDWVDELAKSPAHWRTYRGSVEEVANGPIRSPARQSLVRLNYSFFPKTRHRLKGWTSGGHDGPFVDWADRLKASNANSHERADARAVIVWALENIRFQKDDRVELTELLKRHP